MGQTSVRPQIIITPLIAEAIAKAGYSKDKMKQYLYKYARFPAKRYEHLSPDTYDIGSLCDAVQQDKLPAQFCESNDPDRLVPIVWSPDDFMITVSGGPGKDGCFICAQHGFMGYPTSKKIELPANWEELLKDVQCSP